VLTVNAPRRAHVALNKYFIAAEIPKISAFVTAIHPAIDASRLEAIAYATTHDKIPVMIAR
jgi:hypothetical protein